MSGEKSKIFFSIASCGLLPTLKKKFWVPRPPPGTLGTGAKWARWGPDFGKNVKIATFGQVIPTKLNYLGVIICLGVAKIFFVT